MKKLYIVLLAGLVALTTSSCEKWLDVQPSDEITEKDLFAEGTGYRNALNGIYRQLGNNELYGSALTWGITEVMGQSYYNSRFSKHYFNDFATYKYTTDKAKAQITSMWETAYSAIANCNNLIMQISQEPNTKFQRGQRERELILGEAYALRGFLHFTILSYFAPAPVKKNTKNWIPYHDKFPTMAAEYLPVDATLKRIIADLETGRDLVAKFDCYVSEEEDNQFVLAHMYRFEPNTDVFDDIFFAFRGYRMNVTAAMAILARVYSYAGEHDLAAAEAQKVIDFEIDPGSTYSTPAFAFALKSEAENDYKMTQDLIMAFSRVTLIEDYAQATESGANFTLQMSWSIYPDIFDSESDYRKTVLLNISQDGWDLFPRRFMTPIKGGNKDILDILPVIRLSEMHYIQAESFAAKGDYTNATAKLDVVRKGRGCSVNQLEGKITDAKSFVTELLNEARREYAEEGRIFYYYKKYDTKLNRSMKDEAFYFPLPDTETIH